MLMNYRLIGVGSLAALFTASMIVMSAPAANAAGSFSLTGAGSGLVTCTNGDSFEGSITIDAVQNPDGTVSGTITIFDPDTPATTIAPIDDGKISNNHFKLISNNPESVGAVPFCHGGDDPDIIEIKGTGGEGVRVKFISTCIGVGEDDVECVSGTGRFLSDVTITDTP
jgi:hypothetical protein